MIQALAGDVWGWSSMGICISAHRLSESHEGRRDYVADIRGGGAVRESHTQAGDPLTGLVLQH